MGSLETTEAECAAGRTAPRVSLDDIKANIAAQYTFTAAEALTGMDMPLPVGASLGVLTVCLLQLQNGFTIIGKSAPASPTNFDRELGAKLAYEDAVRQVWPLMGYELRERLHRGTIFPTPAFDCPPDMSRFVGTKTVYAKPMTRQAYNDLRGWTLPADENGDDAGFLVEYADGIRPNLDGYQGYVSWSPAEVFTGAYQPC